MDGNTVKREVGREVDKALTRQLTERMDEKAVYKAAFAVDLKVVDRKQSELTRQLVKRLFGLAKRLTAVDRMDR
jgi:hypothetical protein